MALAGRQIEYAQDGDFKVGRVVDTVVDRNSGIAAQRERTVVEVPIEDGRKAVLIGERLKVVQMVNDSQ